MRRFKSCSGRVGDSRWLGSLTMVSAGNKANCISSVNDTKKQFLIIHHHHHHHHHYPCKNGVKQREAARNTCWKGVSSTVFQRIQAQTMASKCSKNYFLEFYYHLGDILGWVDLIFLTRLVFLEFTWWPV